MSTRADKSEQLHRDLHSNARPRRGGEAFAIDDALLAVRWAALVRERGVTLIFSDACRSADEVLVVRLARCSTPAACIHRGRHVVWSTDHAGHARVFATLAEALLAIAPLKPAERRWMLTGPTPDWLSLPLPTREGRRQTLSARLVAWFCHWCRA